jgi:hypothetical protein
MKKLLILLSIIGFGLTCNAQTSFERGYFINLNGVKTNCFIKNLDWKNNPVEIEFRKLESDLVQKIKTDSLAEFTINGISKYIRFNVNIDRSSVTDNDFDTDLNANFETESLLFKVLIEGKASLYQYTEEKIVKYFFSIDQNPKEQLIYKTFIEFAFRTHLTTGDVIKKNYEFRNQLSETLICGGYPIKGISNLVYEKKPLVRIFTEYNECIGESFIDYEKNVERDLFNLNFRIGLNSTSLSLRNNVDDRYDTEFDNKLSLRIGLEAEFILPFNNNKWAILVEPTFQSYHYQKSPTSGNVEVNFNALDLPIGVRYYLFLNDNSKLFLNGSFIFTKGINSTVEFENRSDLAMTGRMNFGLGFGYHFYKKYSVEARFSTNKELLRNYASWRTDFKPMSIIFGYNLK